MKRVICIILLIVMSISSCSNENGKQKPVEVTELKAQPVEAFGIVKVLDEVDISIGFTAEIEEILVSEGQRVKSGSPLIKVRMDDVDSKMSALKGEIEVLKKEARLLHASIEELDAALENGTSSEMQYLQRKLDYDKEVYDEMMSEYEKMKELYASGSLSADECKVYYKQLREKELAVENSKLTLEKLKASMNETLRQESASLERKRLELSGLEDELKMLNENVAQSGLVNGFITSKIGNGIVGIVDCSRGGIAVQGKRLLQVMDLDSIVIEADVNEQFIKDVKLGAKVFITPEFDRSLEYRGVVSFVSSYAEQKNGETVVTLRIKMDKIDEKLLPGFNVEVMIAVD